MRLHEAGRRTPTVGLVIAGGYVMAAADAGCQARAVTAAAALTVLRTRLRPPRALVAAGAVRGLGLL